MISARTRIIRNSLHVRKWHSVPERAFCGTVVRGAFSKALGVKNRLFWYRSDIRYRKPLLWYGADIRVRKTGPCGTRRIFRGTRCADNYLLLIQEPEHPERDLIVEGVFSIILDHIAIFDVFNLFLSFLSPANLKGLSVNLKI